MINSENIKSFICGVCEGFYGKPWTFCQRKELYARMKRFGMDTYLYAPKDDHKHRLYWRNLYNDDEAEELKLLIDNAKEEDIRFVYSISPGLDIVYSSNDDVNVLKKKLSQVKQLGCDFFALLFDDIEDELNCRDIILFSSIAEAQTSITNQIFNYLDRPELFFFCPTEYCSSRAIPDLTKSMYLKIIGEKLDPEINFLWTGPKVVSRKISIENIVEIGNIVQRPVTIWDNLHANDYDQTRLYLGPYDGRSVELIQHLRGVLTNPNCEFETNFIAMHTLAQWSKNCTTRFPPLPAARMETDEGVSTSYEPIKALACAILDWLPCFYDSPPSTPHNSPNDDRAMEEDTGRSSSPDNLKPLETTLPTFNPYIPNDKLSYDIKRRFDRICFNDIELLCHYFYLPFEHGSISGRMLQSAKWLIDNAKFVCRHAASKHMHNGVSKRTEWFERAMEFHEGYANLATVTDRLVNIPNRDLLYDLYTYVNDMRSNIALVNSYIKWNSIDKLDKEPFKSGEQEPWVYRGGLLGEFRKLLPSERAYDGVCLEASVQKVFFIRPYHANDRNEVNALCSQMYETDKKDEIFALNSLPGDWEFGAFLENSAKDCIVIEDEVGICGCLCISTDALQFYQFFTNTWIESLLLKYPIDTKKNITDQNELLKLLESIHNVENQEHMKLDPDILSQYPSRIHAIVSFGRVYPPSFFNMLIKYCVNTLADASIFGAHVLLASDSQYLVDLYVRLGFTKMESNSNSKVMIFCRKFVAETKEMDAEMKSNSPEKKVVSLEIKEGEEAKDADCQQD